MSVLRTNGHLVIFHPKHSMWVLVKTASASNAYPHVLSKNARTVLTIFPDCGNKTIRVPIFNLITILNVGAVCKRES